MEIIIYMYGCLAHKVQLVIRNGFQERQIEEVILKVKTIVRLVFVAFFLLYKINFKLRCQQVTTISFFCDFKISVRL